jgi:hypothetical protein
MDLKVTVDKLFYKIEMPYQKKEFWDHLMELPPFDGGYARVACI